ncbi:hypothetical protein V7x_34370 [Crateriforma conspicua]|uniref:Uncharacterized protein n=2 Tax=Crateriforma conspicua TaxID=2527996 RepID=A0A5C6FK06_9PLAN|nr:hypothetical protein V7x_34370 [Crateriforma conspicua]
MSSVLSRVVAFCSAMFLVSPVFAADDRLVFTPPGDGNGKHVVLISGDEEYRSEEAMPMLGKILSQKHGFHCTVLFSMSEDGTYIDPNNHTGVRGWETLDDADLIIVGTRFRTPSAADAAHMTAYLNAGKPIIGLRTSTHGFKGDQSFGGDISYDKWGLRVLGEEWVNHHGKHKVQGARGVVQKEYADHPILNGVGEIFVPSDVYGVTHLTDADRVLLRGAVTESLDPKSVNVDGELNAPMQPFAWLHTYTAPDGGTGTSFCTTAGAAIDLADEDLRRLVVNATYHLTGLDVPASADVAFVDPFYPSFYGFIRTEGYWKIADLQPADFGLGRSPSMPDPKGSPVFEARDRPEKKKTP